MASPPPPPRGGLSLYENLHDPNDASSKISATISSAPVLYNQAENSSSNLSSKKPIDPALRFQPIRRPQVKQAKPKPSFPKAGSLKPVPTASVAPLAPAQPKSTLADWAAIEEDEWQYENSGKRQRGGRKKKKKRQQMQIETDWDELYDPSRPTNVEEYSRSDEKIYEVREWKALLYGHRRKRNESELSDENEEDTRHVSNQFAPPPSYSNVPPPPLSPPAPPPNDQTGENAFARRLAMSQGQPPPLPPPNAPPPPPAEPSSSTSTTISRAPIRFAQPELPKDEDYDEGLSPPPILGGSAPDTDEPKSTRPGQVGFAHRLMNKYGWTKGSGLGADETGIINPLQVQVEKRRKKADADGGGWAEPGGKGKIIGGKRKDSTGKFGVMSDVIVLQNMLENMPNLQVEIADGLGQEIGEECGEKYGRVERLYIEQDSRQVFIKFTNQVSALRAVNELDGRVFNGNTIIPKFYDSDKFERGVYR